MAKITCLCRECGWMRDTDQEGYTVGLLYNQMLDHEAATGHHTYEPVDPIPRTPQVFREVYRVPTP